MIFKLEYYLIFLIGIFVFSSCKNYYKQDTNEKLDVATYKVYENKKIEPGAYWHFQLSEGSKKVYEINTGKEKVILEVELDEFEIIDEKLLESKCIIISNDGKVYVPVKGNISCKLNSESSLETQIEISGLEVKEGIDFNEKLLESVDIYDYQVQFKGICKKVNS